MKNNIATIFICMAICMCATGAGAYEIDDALVDAVIAIESSGRPDAWNRKTDCRGLMQVSQIVLKEWDIEKSSFENSCAEYPPCKLCRKPKIDLFNPTDNRRVGTFYLRRLKDHYRAPSLKDVLASYNWGISNCRRVNFEWERYPKSVRAYVLKVLKVKEGK